MSKIYFTGKRVDSIKRAVARRNRKFNKMTDAEKRVAVAKDVIQQLVAEHFVATKGTYCNLQLTGEQKEKAFEQTPDMSTLIEQVPECNVCGIGALFASTVRMRNKVEFTSVYRGTIHNYLDDLFTHSDLMQIEGYFERGSHGNSPDWRAPINSERDDNKRLTMIMENIISNDGTFDPHKGAHRIPQ